MVRRLKLLAPLSLLGLIWATSPAPTQPPAAPAQPKPGEGGGERRTRFGGDPAQMFDRLSGGKDVITRDSLDDRAKFMFDMFAKQMGVTNGQITRSQFTQGADQMRSMMGGGMGGFGGRGPGAGGGGSTMTPQQQDEFAAERFRRSDRNSDGFIDQGEMNERLKPNFQQYDANKDGMIDLNEYKGYMKSFFNQQATEAPQGAAVSIGADGKMSINLTPSTGSAVANPESAKVDDEARAPVFRHGKLPKDIPNWFEQLDTDKDGQIGLYEWVKASKAVDEFRPMDRNDDNFITIDELMAYVRSGSKSPAPGTAVANAPPTGDTRMFGMPMGGDRSGFRFGRPGDSPGGERSGERGGPPRWGKGSDNGGGERGGGPRFGKGSDNSGDRGNWMRWGKGENNYGKGDRGNGSAPGASAPAATTPGAPQAESRRQDRGNRRDDKGKGRQ